MNKANEKRDILSVALDIRHSKSASSFRSQCALFDVALAEGHDRIIYEMIGDVQKKAESLGKDIQAPPLNIDISFPPAISFSPSEILNYVKTQRKHNLIFISQLYNAALLSRDSYNRILKVL
jgi:hypothetical protein